MINNENEEDGEHQEDEQHQEDRKDQEMRPLHVQRFTYKMRSSPVWRPRRRSIGNLSSSGWLAAGSRRPARRPSSLLVVFSSARNPAHATSGAAAHSSHVRPSSGWAPLAPLTSWSFSISISGACLFVTLRCSSFGRPQIKLVVLGARGDVAGLPLWGRPGRPFGWLRPPRTSLA